MNPVAAVLLIALATTYLITNVDWTLFLYLNHVAQHRQQLDSLYITLTALRSLLPSFVSIAAGHLTSVFGTGPVLAISHILVAIGLVLLAARAIGSTLFIAISLFSIAPAMRVVRISAIADIVPPSQRTCVLAWHYCMYPFGAILETAAWLILQQWKRSIFIYGFLIDRYTIHYGFGACLMLLVSITAYAFRSQFNHYANAITDTERLLSEAVPPTPEYESSETRPPFETQPTSYNSATRVAWFVLLMLPVRFTLMIMTVIVQPAMVTHFGLDEAQVGLMYTLLAFTAVIPPVVLTLFSSHLSDRAILIVGLVLKMIGAALYLPIFGPVRCWQVVAGATLAVKASAFFTTAVFSLFTKVVAKGRDRNTMLGYIWAFTEGASALLQLLLSNFIMRLFGRWGLVVYLWPVYVAIVLVLHPSLWLKFADGGNNSNCIS